MQHVYDTCCVEVESMSCSVPSSAPGPADWRTQWSVFGPSRTWCAHANAHTHIYISEMPTRAAKRAIPGARHYKIRLILLARPCSILMGFSIQTNQLARGPCVHVFCCCFACQRPTHLHTRMRAARLFYSLIISHVCVCVSVCTHQLVSVCECVCTTKRIHGGPVNPFMSACVCVRVCVSWKNLWLVWWMALIVICYCP